MIIRPATAQESLIIADFQILMARETENFELHPETVRAGVRAVFEDPSKGKYYVAEEKSEILGSLLTTYEWSDWRNKSVLWIQSVYVRPEFRKSGVFKALYEYIQKLVDGNTNFSGIRLYVDKTNIKARDVYTKCGMNGEHYLVFEKMKD
jgi:GNAT superfamily N-acetyltransferase